MKKNLQYPIGEFVPPENVTEKDLEGWIDTIEGAPEQLRKVLDSLPVSLVDTSYRPGGWTVRQIVHHLADSHMNSYIRFKLALTENCPTIKAYDEKAWANLPDCQTSIDVSLQLLESLHKRWCQLLKSMSLSDFEKTFYHPETKQDVKLSTNVALYAWHSKHHIEHIKLVSVH
ncbi:YfiT family bacillithiol transferase [Metabacillus halosaccharovorans]|uniref:YfiT family bacillithiol transferase n=1 Tax=Metabacillus halosaccharovorans TaxID=930124 RepID=UPI000994B342|nr:bacillithiol transferase BstA [Metabacillus halosaccharovorans]